MGVVYEGLHAAIERRVAIKVLHAALGQRADMATRFINEARAVNRIDHPGLVQISDYGQLPDGTAYIVMEYLKGETFGQRIKRLGTRLAAADVLRLGRQICTALAAAHDKEIVHRDLKPDNIMIIPNPDAPGGEQVKILDFGIAKVAEIEAGTGQPTTRAGTILGTPIYMSPEQCKNSVDVDVKSDVYSLGVIFYELLAGLPPFSGNAFGELLLKHMLEEPPPLAAKVEPETPEALVQLVHRMMIKDKAQRPTMRQVLAEIDRIGGFRSGAYQFPQAATALPPGTPAPATLPNAQSVATGPSVPSQPGTPPPPGGLQASQAAPLGITSGQLPSPPPRKFPLGALLGGLALVVAVSGVLVTSLNKPRPPAPTPVLPPQPVVQSTTTPPATKLVHWTVVTQPDGAKVVRPRDGQVLGITPLSVQNPAASGTEELRVTLQGYVDATLTMDRDKDSEQKLELRRKSKRDRRKDEPGQAPSEMNQMMKGLDAPPAWDHGIGSGQNLNLPGKSRRDPGQNIATPFFHRKPPRLTGGLPSVD